MALKDSTLTSNKSMLLPNNDLEMKTDNIVATPIALDIDDLSPNYFDTSIAPNGAILYYNDIAPYTESSKAEIQRNGKGVLSFAISLLTKILINCGFIS
ncbi:unnamed protein product [Rotaria socialis]|uniref:Uncharacterized protein n=1 Tax=Rotaria socialis TaxID=392032 RepID=A0A821J0B5_9BILA|nr:unnamed protein product [Rotaria socialis]CAF4996222.1 unnamed protein product [Rotaria socialis]